MRRDRVRQPSEGGRLNRTIVGTAGWSIPPALADRFPGEGAHLARYARVFAGAEINSSFHRPHRPGTYARWAAATPPGFRFSAKLPKAITHRARLVDAEALLDGFAAEVAGLGDKLAVLLVQLPPSLAFEAGVADRFFARVRERFGASLACEPRHPSWFAPAADACLTTHQVARVAADPVLAAGGEQPGGWAGLRYHRLHGAPRLYYSAYGEAFLHDLAARLRASDAPTWCVFDNTASGAAAANALSLQAILGAPSACDNVSVPHCRPDTSR